MQVFAMTRGLCVPIIHQCICPVLPCYDYSTDLTLKDRVGGPSNILRPASDVFPKSPIPFILPGFKNLEPLIEKLEA
jgi:hypothetical protein